MGKIKGVMGKAAAAALAVSVIFQGTALAAPADELNELLEKQKKNASASLLEETLGLTELVRAIHDNGLNLQVRAGLSEGTKIPGTDESLPEDGYATLGIQIDPAQEAWAVTAGAGIEEQSLLDLILYGDKEQLALTAPQFFAGAVALSAGNLREQYEASALSEILGGAAYVPELDLSFYPETGDFGDDAGFFGDLKRQIEEKAEELEENMRVEKPEEEGTIYRATVSTGDIMDFYSIILEGYLSMFDALDLMAQEADAEACESAVDTMLEQMEAMLGDEIPVDFYTENGRIEKLHFELYCDTTVLDDADEIMTEIVEEELAPAGNAKDAGGAREEAEPESRVTLNVAEIAEEMTGEMSEEIPEDGEFQGYISYDIIYRDPEDVSKGYNLDMCISDVDGEEYQTFHMEWKRTQEGSLENYSCFIDMTEDGEIAYSGELLSVSFNSDTGDFDITLSVENDEDNTVSLKLDSTFSEIEKGKGFVWTMDSLIPENAGEQAGVTYQFQISADPGDIPAPEDVRDILKLSDTELTTLMQEIQLNALIWGAQFATEEETEAEIASGL